MKVTMGAIGSNAHVLKYKAAVARLRKGDDPLRLAHAVRHLGDAYRHAGRAALAESCYVESLSIYRGHKNAPPLDLANAIRGFAVLKDEGGAAEEAKRLWEEARNLYVAVNVPSGVAESAARLALLARCEGDLQRSREWLGEATSAADASGEHEILQYIRKVRTQMESKT